MKFIVSSTYLLKQLQVLGGVINNSNTLPILDNFLFDLKQDKLTVSASDLETTMSSVLNVDSDNEGTIAVPARLLLETLKTFPEQPLTFVVEDNNTVEISSNHGKYALAYADGAEFPKAVEITNKKERREQITKRENFIMTQRIIRGCLPGKKNTNQAQWQRSFRLGDYVKRPVFF